MKLLSIIIPHYNSKSSLFRLLNSIDWNSETEVIVIDDNSLESEFNLKEFEIKYPQAIFLKNYKGKGAGGARNCGIEKSTGFYLMFADSDDYLLENYYETIKNNLNDEVEIYYFYPTSHNEERNELGKRHEVYVKRLKEYEACKKREILYRFYVPWSKIIRKDFILHNNLSFEEVPASNDVMFSLKTIFFSSNIKIIPNEIYVVTESQNSLTKTPTFKNLNSRFEVAIRFNEFLKGKGFKDELTSMAPHIHSFMKHIGLVAGIRILIISIKKKQPVFKNIHHFLSIFRHI